jgi:hypothetical protein
VPSTNASAAPVFTARMLREAAPVGVFNALTAPMPVAATASRVLSRLTRRPCRGLSLDDYFMRSRSASAAM